MQLGRAGKDANQKYREGEAPGKLKSSEGTWRVTLDREDASVLEEAS